MRGTMQHWQPEQEQSAAIDPPADAWIAWLNRAPLHDVAPPPRVRQYWGAPAVALALAGFWVSVGAIGWSLIA